MTQLLKHLVLSTGSLFIIFFSYVQCSPANSALLDLPHTKKPNVNNFKYFAPKEPVVIEAVFSRN